MAHQAHSIPWGVLLDHASFSTERGVDLELRYHDKPDQVSAMLFFARSYAAALREYAGIERRKYAPAEEYRRRTDSWISSDHRSDYEIAAEKTGPPKWGKKTVAVETKKVISDADRTRWYSELKSQYHPPREEDQYIENWIEGGRSLVLVESLEQRRYVERAWWEKRTDQVKTLLLDASYMLTPIHERQQLRDQEVPPHLNQMDTLFLLAHHNAIPLTSDWTSFCNSCCYIQQGMVSLIEVALRAHIYYNFLFALRERDAKMWELTYEAAKPHWWIKRTKMLVQRPKYMTTTTHHAVVSYITQRHDCRPENMATWPFIWPGVGENFSPPSSSSTWVWTDHVSREETDIMTVRAEDEDLLREDPLRMRGSAAGLKEWLRGFWKLMVNYEMLWSDTGHAVQWERKILGALNDTILCHRPPSSQRVSLLWRTYDERGFNSLDALLESKLRDWSYELDDWIDQVEPTEGDEPDARAKAPSQREKKRIRKREARREARAEDRLNGVTVPRCRRA